MFYSTKRQQFLIDQGYAFKVITRLEGLECLPNLVYPSHHEQIELLSSVLLVSESEAEIGSDVKAVEDDLQGAMNPRDSEPSGRAQRTFGSLNTLSGAQYISYVEQKKSTNRKMASEVAHGGGRHKIFTKRQKRLEIARREQKEDVVI